MSYVDIGLTVLLNAPHSVFMIMSPPSFRAELSPSLMTFSTFSTYAPLVPVPKIEPSIDVRAGHNG